MNNLTEQLSRIVKAAMPEESTSVSYSIMRHGEIVAADALGNQGGKEKKKADLSCTYNVASVSKIYCTASVMQLVEKGLLKLDEPVCTYLPHFEMPMDERYRKITLRHCLSHTSGLPGTQWRGFSVSSVEGADYYSDVYDYLSKSTLKSEPGEYAVYCNDGFTLAEMVVAQVSGVPFARYCMENIAEAIGAHSTRHSAVINSEYPLIKEGKKPGELLLIQGGAGITTSMTDLCKFGELFLKENPVIAEESKKEMASPQGRTFLKSDDRTELYGLGWDNVDYKHEDYDLGDGVLLKGGNSFQFDTQFFIIPKYDTVLAISETHDCRLNINGMILRLFATMMLQQGVNIYTKYKPVPEDIKEKYSGMYLMPGCAADLRINGAVADLVRVGSRGHESLIYHDLWWDGESFNGENNQKFFFEESEGSTFLMTHFRTRSFGAAMKAEVFGYGNKAWEDRKGKDYVVCSIDVSDIVIYEIMTGFRVCELKDFAGVYQMSFSGRSDGGVYGMFDAPVHAVDDNIGRGFLRTPTNPSRDMVDPIFHVKDGVEYCDVASYTYRAAASLPGYESQAFPVERRKNGVYSIKQELKALPEIPEGHRILILNKEMVSVYDSLFDEKYTPVKEGYIILV